MFRLTVTLIATLLTTTTFAFAQDTGAKSNAIHKQALTTIKEARARQAVHAEAFAMDMNIVSQAFDADYKASKQKIAEIADIFAKYEANKKASRRTSGILEALCYRLEFLSSAVSPSSGSIPRKLLPSIMFDGQDEPDD
ncbi:MAG: hypothetical protein Q9M44_05280, partial [Ghiorsea sp.]|nr:hypothetical protein [Ghiorsea sp.]